jgi:hypothetical protein
MDEPIRFLDVPIWNAYKARTGVDLHVFIDGEDVTTRCYRACAHQDYDTTQRGEVWLFCVNAKGEKYLDPATGLIAKEQRVGIMAIQPGAPL